MDEQLPIHPRTGLAALAVLPSGRVVWPVLGGSGDGGGDGAGGGDGGGSGGDAGAGDGGGGRTFTQADVDRIVSERLARERSKYSDYEQLKAKADELDKLREEQASETEKALKNARKEAEEQVRAQFEPQLLRLQAALKHGLPDELGARVLNAAKRLVGSTLEELEADAKEFFAAAPIVTEQRPPSFDQGPRGTGSAKTAPTVASGAELYAQRNKKT